MNETHWECSMLLKSQKNCPIIIMEYQLTKGHEKFVIKIDYTHIVSYQFLFITRTLQQFEANVFKGHTWSD